VLKGNLLVDLSYNTNTSKEYYSYKDLTKEVSIELAKAIQQALSEIEKKAQKIG
jgi:hypothetical protein